MTAAVALPVDTVGAFVGPPALLAIGAPDGPLAGRTVAVKDLFDVAGTTTGGGNPTFAADRAPATAHATAVRLLVDAGASVVGKAVTDELAYSLAGTNVHFGTPTNTAAPGHAPGGSSSGSAAAVGAGLVDLGLGTDTGGSIRVPASYGGLWGWRPTHGAVPIDGVLPLGPSFDTVGLLARRPALLVAAADVLLGAGSAAAGPIDEVRVAVPAETLAELTPALAAALVAAVDGAPIIDLRVSLGDAFAAFRAVQGWEAWASHGAWIAATDAHFGPDVAGRFAAASEVTADEVAAARVVRAEVTRQVLAATTGGTVLAIPAAAGGAPPLDADPSAVDDQRVRTLRLTCLAGLAGCPAVSVPLLHDGDLPLGITFVGAPGTDRTLLAWAAATFGP